MRLLLVSPFLPYPEAMAGAPRAIYDRVRLLARAHNVTVVTLYEPGEERHRAELARLGVRLYAVPRHVPRMLAQKWRKRLRLAAGLVTDRRPMLVQEFASRSLCRLISSVACRERFDAVLVEHILAAQYIRCLPQYEAPVILTEHDVRGSFPTGAGRELIKLPFVRLDNIKWARYARASYREAAVVSVPTDEDAAQLRRKIHDIAPPVVPFGLDCSAQLASGTQPQRHTERDDRTLLFVGNFDHPPNRDAVEWLCAEIMPLVWHTHPDARVVIAGRNPTPSVRALASARVDITGEVPSVAPYLQSCALFVAPLRSGGGLRMKLLEALGAGAPVITTSLGAQGLGAEAGRHLLISDGAVEFASAIVRALDDPALRVRLAREGQQLVGGAHHERERAENLEALLEAATEQGSRVGS